MEFETSIDPVEGVRRHTIRGHVSGSELVSALKNFYATSPDAVPLKALWDFTGAELALASDEVNALVELVERLRHEAGSLRSAIVMSEDLAFGLGRMFESLLSIRSESPVRVCRTMEEAEDWLSQGPSDGLGPGAEPA